MLLSYDPDILNIFKILLNLYPPKTVPDYIDFNNKNLKLKKYL